MGLALLCGWASACDPNSPTYFDADAPLEVAIMSDAMGKPITEAKETLALKFRAPTAEEAATLAPTAARNYALPWLRADQVHLELLYTVTNLADKDDTFRLAMDGASEIVRYDEDAVAAVFETADEKPVFIGLVTAVPQNVPAHGSYQGVLREDDFTEASLDLDAMGRWMAYFASVLINRSDVNPVGLDMVPPDLVRPALFEVTVRFASQSHMICRYSLRVRDDKDLLLKTGQTPFEPMPMDYMPTIMKKK
jgi:hypothetical protein